MIIQQTAVVIKKTKNIGYTSLNLLWFYQDPNQMYSYLHQFLKEIVLKVLEHRANYLNQSMDRLLKPYKQTLANKLTKPG